MFNPFLMIFAVLACIVVIIPAICDSSRPRQARSDLHEENVAGNS